MIPVTERRDQALVQLALEHAEALALQAEIEVKRTALLVLHQEVLQSVAKELDAMRESKTESLELKWEEPDK